MLSISRKTVRNNDGLIFPDIHSHLIPHSTLPMFSHSPQNPVSRRIRLIHAGESRLRCTIHRIDCPLILFPLQTLVVHPIPLTRRGRIYTVSSCFPLWPEKFASFHFTPKLPPVCVRQCCAFMPSVCDRTEFAILAHPVSVRGNVFMYHSHFSLSLK